MCVIAVMNKDTGSVSKEKFDNCWKSNKDGFGMMWVDDGKVNVYKTLNQVEAYSEYEKLLNKSIKDIVLHFRIGTQGGNNLDNCHPFTINNDLVFCHNGILTQYSNKYYRDAYPGKSDTRIFNEKILSNLPSDFLDNKETCALIEDFAGTDKLVFMSPQGSVILNKHYGTVDKETGVWYSNSSYISVKYTAYNGTTQSTKFYEHKCEKCGIKVDGLNKVYVEGNVHYSCRDHLTDVLDLAMKVKEFEIADVVMSKTNKNHVAVVIGKDDDTYTIASVYGTNAVRSSIKKAFMQNIYKDSGMTYLDFLINEKYNEITEILWDKIEEMEMML